MAEPKSALEAMTAALAGDTNDTLAEDIDTAADATDNLGSDVAEGDDQNVDGHLEGDDKEAKLGEGDPGEAELDGKVDVEPSMAQIRDEADELGVSLRDVGGKFKSKEQLVAEVAAAKGTKDGAKGDKPIDGKDGKAGKKEPDALNDPLNKAWGPEVNQRIRTLIDRTKGAEEKAAKSEQDFNFLVNGVQQTGASPEQYGETLSWLALFNSPETSSKKQALDLVVTVAERLATQLGVDLKFGDPLEQHPDLRQALQGGKITAEFAREMARNRNQQGFNSQMQATAHQTQQAEQAAQAEKERGRVEMNQLEAQLKANDPQFDRKLKTILPMVEAAMKRVRPSEWKTAFMEIYSRVPASAPGRVVAANTKLPANQPLRGGKNPAGAGGAGGMSPGGPASALDAMNEALGKMR